MTQDAPPQGVDERFDASAVVDDRGTIIAWSDGARRLLGYTSEDVTGQNIRDLMLAGVAEWTTHASTDRNEWRASARFRHKEGYELHRLIYAQPLPGEGVGWLWMFSVSPVEPAAAWSSRSGPGLDATEQQYWARRRIELMAAASQRIGTTLDLSRTAEELAEMGTDHFADFVAVDLLNKVFQGDEAPPSLPGRLVFRRAAHISVLEGTPEAVVPIGGIYSYPEDSPPGRALATGRGSLHTPDEAAMARWAADFPERARTIKAHKIHSMMTVPLQARGVALGLVGFCRHRTLEPFNDADLWLAEELAARAAVCVDNAHRYMREQATVIALQRRLLPHRTPEQSAVEVATRYRPAGSDTGVGGDWYDVIALSGARVALVVGDVVGHGLHAAAAMGGLRTAVRTLADVDLTPDELLTRLDDLVIREARDTTTENTHAVGEMSATCLYVVYDPVSRHCSLASAGHPPPAFVTPDRIQFPDVSVGPPLGVGGLPFETFETDLPEGSLITLYTDGLLVNKSGDVDTGLKAITQVLGLRLTSLEKTCDLLLDALLAEKPSDDSALLLARTRTLGAEHVAVWDVPPDPAAVSKIRKWVSDRLTSWGMEAAVFTTELVVSELVTNAIRYGSPPVQLRLIKDSALICEVSDSSSTAPHLRRARAFDEGGRGLLLVAQLADRWGTRHTPTGKTIWAEQTPPEPLSM
ncbi:SpoIIE family protein phosphatase [Streptomyces phaeochromogenes]|uniref:SpoIIE family protein phosphatase n=1 Tax=Streptomyces phaeochromogenes TaxID=1923 RepID=UPI00386AB9F6|nr:SpoIIE family protein phosphatase [Streptomyces phaeochromogenes]